MWYVNGNNISMTEGDFGIELPITVHGVTLGEQDSIKFTIKSGDATIIEKDFSDISHNTINLDLTEAESALLPVGLYSYVLDWYQNGVFMCNIIPSGRFVVGDKA